MLRVIRKSDHAQRHSRLSCRTFSFQLSFEILADHNLRGRKMKLFIGNLPYDISEPELMNLFAEYGDIVETKLMKDQFTGKSRGFAFVEMSSRSDGQQAMEALNRKKYKNKELVCSEATLQKKSKRRR
jgi:RNA recognition motif-containing protein